MLSTFFSTSKPIHYLLIALLLMLAIAGLIFSNEAYDWTAYLLILPALVAVGLIQFVIIKNEFTKSNTYALFTGSIFLIIALVIDIHWKPVVTLLLLLLALRRLLSLRIGVDYIKKIFDASFWIAIAGLIESWSTLFFITVYVAIFLFARHQFRYWFVPVIASLSVLIIAFTIDQFVSWNVLHSISHGWQLDPLWEYHSFDVAHLPLVGVALITVIGVLIYLFKYTTLQKSERPKQLVLVVTALIVLSLVMFSYTTYLYFGSLWIIIMTSIFMARFVQQLHRKLWKELLLWIPLLLLLLALITS